MLATLALARRVERAEIDFCARAARAGLPGGAESLEVAGARALCGAPGSPLNKLLGLGLGAPVTDGDLERIAGFYAARGEPAQVELCPLAPPDLAARLARHGFEPRGFENQLARAAPFDALPEATGVAGRACDARDDPRWLEVVSRGFAAGAGRAEATAQEAAALARILRAFLQPGITRYLAEIAGEPAGAGASFLEAGVLGIVGTSTLPGFRRRGVQRALVARALRDGDARAELASATVEPGSPSQRTFERLGFRVLYTRALFVRPAPGA